jgi:hypothetical protein
MEHRTVGAPTEHRESDREEHLEEPFRLGDRPLRRRGLTEGLEPGGIGGVNTSTVTAPATTRIKPARNGALIWSKARFMNAVRSVLTTGAPPNTRGMT